MTSDSISVAVRVRPAKNNSDVEEWGIQDTVIYAARPECQQNVFAFDHIFSQDKTNADVYDRVVQPIIDSVLAGYHGTVFAYGQTSSGKTHTMMGNDHDPGVIKRAIASIYNEVKKSTDREFLIRISYLEIYNEQIRDLLNVNSTNLQIKGPDMAVSGLTEKVTSDAETLLRFMAEGDKNRQVGCTNMNERSSRSHSIFRVTVESSNRDPETNKRDGVKVSQLNLVDLAGSERATQTGATGTRLREGCHINTSLTALGIVIRKLSTGEKHINFRDSKLTRILQNSLGGNSRTAIICNVSPTDYETTLSTLRFGSDAKRIKNKPMINQVISEDASLLQKRNREIETLKELISKVEAGKEQQLKEKDETITQLKRKIEGLQNFAFVGELPSTVSDRNTSVFQVKKMDIRRRETWCPGQLAAATPAKSAAVFENADSGDDSFIAKYGTYQDDFDALCTPARPKKRNAEEAFPVGACSAVDENVSMIQSRNVSVGEGVESLLKEANEEIASLKEEVAFLRNEKKTCCGFCTPPLAKRLCSSGTVAKTPLVVKEQGLSLINEEESEQEEDSPFGQRLKIMATPRQKIQGMRQENKLLKRSLLAASSCSSPVQSEDTVLTLCNRTPFPRVETCDVSCQYDLVEEKNILPAFVETVEVSTSPIKTASVSTSVSTSPIKSPEEETVDISSSLKEPCRDAIRSSVDVSTSPYQKTSQHTSSSIGISTSFIEPAVKEADKICFDASTSPVSLLVSDRKSELIPTSTPKRSLITSRLSRASWLTTECTPTILPVDIKDVHTQTSPEKVFEKPETNETATQKAAIALTSQNVQCSASVSDANTSWDVSVEGEESSKETVENFSQTPYLNTQSQEIQCSVSIRNADTSFDGPDSRDSSTQTDGEGKVASTDGLKGLDALLPSTASMTKVETKDVGVMARLEELWVIKLKLDQEKTAREEAEQKLEKVWEETRKLSNTNDMYLTFFKKNGIDPKAVLSGQDRAIIAKSENDEAFDILKKKYDALKEFCFRHPDIKERVLDEKVIIRQKPIRATQTEAESSGKKTENESEPRKSHTSYRKENHPPITADEEKAAGERPLVDLEALQQFKGVQYLSQANPGDCKQS